MDDLNNPIKTHESSPESQIQYLIDLVHAHRTNAESEVKLSRARIHELENMLDIMVRKNLALKEKLAMFVQEM